MARAFFRNLLPIATVVSCLGLALPGAAQPVSADSLKTAIAQERIRLAEADTGEDLRAAFDARVGMAALVRAPEAMRLLKEARALADSLDRPDLGAFAQGLLAERLVRRGDHAAALREVALGDSLQRLSGARQQDSLLQAHAHRLAQVEAQQDSTARAAFEREKRLAVALREAEQRAERWMYAALAAGVLGLVAVLLLLYRAGSTARRRHATIAALREELEAVRKERPEQRAAASLQPPYARQSQAPAALQPTVDEAMRPVALGLFRKGAPERLATLRDARQRGDTEKVMRVVATLKPLLTGLDRDRSAALMARLRMPEASDNLAQWNADLDALETVLREQEAQGGGH